MRKVAIIGGGAAGLFAAIVANQHGAEVTIYEQNERVGKKILATGNGRCNYSNINASAKNYNPNAKSLIHSVWQQFSPAECIEYFKKIGIEPKLEEKGKLFPRSEQASSVLDVLRYQVAAREIKLCTEKKVTKISPNANGLSICNKNYDAVILAAGGKAMPNSGSDGNAYTLATTFGHSVTELKPAIVQFKLKADYLSAIQGVKIGGKAELYADDKLLANDSGDILFANYGISGPPILQLSRYYARSQNKNCYLKINLFPELTKSEIIEILTRRKELAVPLIDYMIGFLHKKLIPTVLKLEKLDKKRNSTSLTDDEIALLAERLSAWHLEITGTKAWQSAQVTVGGIDLNEVSPNLSSYCLPNLYFAGEILDVDGECGGYNLQWAWASAYVAGMNAAIGEL